MYVYLIFDLIENYFIPPKIYAFVWIYLSPVRSPILTLENGGKQTADALLYFGGRLFIVAPLPEHAGPE